MPDSPEKLVVALGGNAISNPESQGTIEEQFAQTNATAQQLGAAIAAGHQLIITHGNGPQVGNVLRRVEIARTELYPIPLEVCVADTQAGMGYMIAQCLTNDLHTRGHAGKATTIVTSVLVERHDPAFENPTKPIGPRLLRSIAEAHQREDGWHIREVADGAFRRIVPSPLPQAILEQETIAGLVDAGQHVVCCGGGGIPVYRDEQGHYQGAAAVIDKDLTTALLARSLGLSTVVILTGVERVCLDFGTPDQTELAEITLAEAQQHAATGQFAAGSMGPKIDAAIDFLTHSEVPNSEVFIGHVDKFTEILAGNSGTRITS